MPVLDADREHPAEASFQTVAALIFHVKPEDALCSVPGAFVCIRLSLVRGMRARDFQPTAVRKSPAGVRAAVRTSSALPLFRRQMSHGPEECLTVSVLTR